MNNVAAIVQSVFESAVREINALEGRIVEADDDLDAVLWEQARQVKAQLDKGLTQRALAAQWINLRTKEPYSQSHVRNTVAVMTEYFTTQPRPRFRDCYNVVANAKSPKPPKPRPAAEPFIARNGMVDLRQAVEDVIAKWPAEARGLAPQLLQALAETLQGESDIPNVAVVEKLVHIGLRGLAKKHHPDAGGSHEHMVAANHAAEWLLARAGGTKAI